MPDKMETQAQGSVKVEHPEKEKPEGCLHSIIIVFLAILVVAVVSIGVLFIMSKNNINGFADAIRPQIRNYPVLKYFMPKGSSMYDPDDPKYLSNKQIVDKYNEYRLKVDSLNLSLEQANITIEQLQKSGDDTLVQRALIEENKMLLEEIKAQREAIVQDQKFLEQLILQGDKAGFAAYFEKVNKATAETIYAEIAKGMLIDEEKSLLAEPFSKMDPQRAANMLSELYEQDTQAMLDILEGMQAKIMAPILERMEPKTAAEIYSLLAERKLNN